MAAPATLPPETYTRDNTIPAKQFIMATGISPDLTPIDLTDATITATFGLGRFRLVKKVSEGITITDAVGGVFQIDEHVLPHAGMWVADLKIIYSTGRKKTYIRWEIEILQDV